MQDSRVQPVVHQPREQLLIPVRQDLWQKRTPPKPLDLEDLVPPTPPCAVVRMHGRFVVAVRIAMRARKLS